MIRRRLGKGTSGRDSEKAPCCETAELSRAELSGDPPGAQNCQSQGLSSGRRGADETGVTTGPGGGRPRVSCPGAQLFFSGKGCHCRVLTRKATS